MSGELTKQREDSWWSVVWKSSVLAVVLFAVGVTVVFPRGVLELILPDQTVYADGFSDEKFARVRLGMTGDEVLATIGPPLEVVIEPASRQTYKASWADRPSAMTGVRRFWWDYSRAGRVSDSYNVRSVELSPDGKVVNVSRHRYED